jgi:hypothetical protein
MRRHTLLWTLVLCLTTAVVTSASAARRDTTLILAVRPSVTVFYTPVNATVSGIEPGSLNLKLQFQECGLYPRRFRDALQAVAPGGPGGTWSGPVTVLASGTFRATEGPVVSNHVRFQTRARVLLAPTRLAHYRAYVDGRLSFWRKRVRIERYDRSRWVLVRTVVLDRTDPVTTGSPPFTYITSRSDEFALKLPRRTKLRAVFPLSQAKPCYAAGTSEVVET